MSAETVLSGEVGRQVSYPSEPDTTAVFVLDANPFMGYIPGSDISEADRALLIQKQGEQAAYDKTVGEALDSVRLGAYNLIVRNSAPQRAVRLAWEKHQKNLQPQAARSQRQPRKLLDFTQPIELATKRPFYKEDAEMAERADAFTRFSIGSMDLEDLLEGMMHANDVNRAVIAKRLRADEARIRREGACNGLDPELMLPQKGESTQEGRSACLNCKAFGSCAIVACLGTDAFGIRMALSGSAVTGLRRELGGPRIRSVAVGVHLGPVKEAINDMAQELQELLDPLGLGKAGRRSSDRKIAEAFRNNKLLVEQFGEALVALVEEFGYLKPAKAESADE